MSDIIEHVGSLASFIGSLTVVGGALMWLYNKLVSAPREKKRQRDADKRQRAMIELITVLNDGAHRWLDSPQRVSGTIAEQAFDIATVNKNERKLYLTRVGAGSNRVVSY